MPAKKTGSRPKNHRKQSNAPNNKSRLLNVSLLEKNDIERSKSNKI